MENKRMKIMLCFLILLTLASLCCESNTSIKIDGKVPPTFTLDGNASLYFFVVSEHLSTKSLGQDYTILWKIEPAEEIKRNDIRVWQYPPITYGKIPVGFKQIIPLQGEPPSLISGKIYSA